MDADRGGGARRDRAESIRTRKSKVDLRDFARLPDDFSWYKNLRMMIPDILKGRDLEELSEAIAKARSEARPVIVMMGAHVVKCGLGPLVCNLMRRKVITALAINGACAIHDVEIGMWGRTSEDVGEGLKSGLFGSTEETAAFFDGASRACLEARLGLGTVLGRELIARGAPNCGVSVLASAQQAGVPVTVHVAIGTDVVHQYPAADGQAIGYATMQDFRAFASTIMNLKGGVVLNIGSAVILPEVFLKALAMARNAGADLGRFTTANFDMISLYRPSVNVVERPRLLGARTYNFCGSHEIILPVLFASLVSRLRP